MSNMQGSQSEGAGWIEEVMGSCERFKVMEKWRKQGWRFMGRRQQCSRREAQERMEEEEETKLIRETDDSGQSRVVTCSHILVLTCSHILVLTCSYSLEVCILEGSHGAEQAQDGADRFALKVRKVPDGLRTKTHFSLWKLQSHTSSSKYSNPQLYCIALYCIVLHCIVYY